MENKELKTKYVYASGNGGEGGSNITNEQNDEVLLNWSNWFGSGGGGDGSDKVLLKYEHLNSDLLALIELNKNNPNQLVIDLRNQFNIKYK